MLHQLRERKEARVYIALYAGESVRQELGYELEI